MLRLLAISAIGALLVVTGCSSPPPDEPSPVATTTTEAPTQEPEPEPEVEPVVEVAEPQWTQDLWIFDRFLRFNKGGAEIDFTGSVLSNLEKATPEQVVEVADGVTFRVYDKTKPSIIDGAGKKREDVEVLAGLLDFDDETVYAVLATPDADAQKPIGLEDQIEMDLTFMGDSLQPGDPMAFDFSFVQTLPGSDPAGASGLELLASRFANEQFNFYGAEVDGETEILAFTAAIGEAVEGSTRGQMPAKGKISDPGLKGFRDGARSAGKGGLNGVRKFFKNFAKGAKESNRLIRCNLGSCSDPIPPPKPPKKCWIRCGKVSGDPHLVTFDELRFSPQAIGEFVLVESDDFTVQMRTAPMGSSRNISVMTGVAVEADGHRFVMSTGEGTSAPLLFIDNKRVDLTDLPQEITAGDAQVTASTAEVVIVTTQEGRVTTSLGRSSLTVFIDSGKRDGLAGMLGDGDGNPDNDMTTREGKMLAKDIENTDTKAFYETYVNSWRIAQDESLFLYLPGQDTQTYTDLTFPEKYMSIDTVKQSELNQAKAVCRTAGIVSPEILQDCVFDFWASGDMEFVRIAQQMDLHDGLNTGRLEFAEPDAGGQEPADTAGDQEIPDGHGPKEGQTMEDYVRTQWSYEPHSRYFEGDTFDHYCPPGGSPTERVWGGVDQRYTSDSSVCTAAVHAGIITPKTGGLLHVVMAEGGETFLAAPPAHGVEPSEYLNSWGSVITFK